MKGIIPRLQEVLCYNNGHGPQEWAGCLTMWFPRDNLHRRMYVSREQGQGIVSRLVMDLGIVIKCRINDVIAI